MALLVHFSLLLLAFVLLLRPHPAEGLKGDAACGRFLCVNATVGDTMIRYEVTSVFNRPPGWVALGFGYHMKSSHMVIMWENRDGSRTISQRYATGHREPIILHNPPRIAHLVEPSKFSWQTEESKTFAFEIPLNYTHRPFNPSDPHIWAYSVRQPVSSSPDIYTLGQHFAAGSLKLDLSKDVSMGLPAGYKKVGLPYDPPTNDIDSGKGFEVQPINRPTNTAPSRSYKSHEYLLIWHGGLLSFGLLVLLPAGSLAARWGRTLTPSWFPLHRLLNYYIALPMILVGWILGPTAVFNGDSSHMSDSHKICGLFLIFLYFFQVSLGRYIHARKKAVPERPPHPPSNILHVAFGIILIGLAFLQVRSGLDEWNMATAFRVPYWIRRLWEIWVVAIPFLYIVGLTLLRRQFFQERNGVGPSFSLEGFTSYTMLNNEDIKYTEQVYSESGGMFVNGVASTSSLNELRERDQAVPLLHSRR